MSLNKWLITNREQPVLADTRGYCWEPGGTHSTVGFPQDYLPVMCWDLVPEFTHELVNHPSDLVSRLGLLCVFSGDEVSSLCVPPVLFDRALSQPVLSDLGILVPAGVHFDLSGPVLYPGGDSVRAGPHLLVSGDTSNGDRLPVTMAACPLTGGFVCCDWLQFVTLGAEPVAPPISVRAHTVVLWRLGDMNLDCVHSAGIKFSCAWIVLCILRGINGVPAGCVR